MRVLFVVLLFLCLACVGFGAGGCASADGKSLATAAMGEEVVRDNINGGKTDVEVEALIADVKSKIDKAVPQVDSADVEAVKARADLIAGIEKQIRSLTIDPITRKNLEDYFKAAVAYEKSK